MLRWKVRAKVIDKADEGKIFQTLKLLAGDRVTFKGKFKENVDLSLRLQPQPDVEIEYLPTEKVTQGGEFEVRYTFNYEGEYEYVVDSNEGMVGKIVVSDSTFDIPSIFELQKYVGGETNGFPYYLEYKIESRSQYSEQAPKKRRK